MSPGRLHSLTLVLSSARSGSSLLCRDLQSLGGLGSPQENLKGLGRQVRRGPVSEKDVLERLAQGCQDEAPGVAATILMVSHAGVTYRALAGQRAGSLNESLIGVVSWAREHFDRVLLVVLVRNALDQAITRVSARTTGMHHSTDRAHRAPESVALSVDDLNKQILAELVQVAQHRRMLDSALSAHADIALPLTYEELTGRPEDTTCRLVAHARAQGFEVHREVVTRRLRKLTGVERSEAIRDSFLAYLRTECGT